MENESEFDYFENKIEELKKINKNEENEEINQLYFNDKD